MISVGWGVWLEELTELQMSPQEYGMYGLAPCEYEEYDIGEYKEEK